MLIVVVASMLLMCTKEELFLSALTELSATGVGRQRKEQPLVNAKCQSFFSARLTVPVSRSTLQQRPPSPALDRHLVAGASLPPTAQATQRTNGSFFPQIDDDGLGVAYKDMDVARAQDKTDGARESRAERVEKIKKKRSAPSSGVDCSQAACTPTSAAGAGLDVRSLPLSSAVGPKGGSPSSGRAAARPRGHSSVGPQAPPPVRPRPSPTARPRPSPTPRRRPIVRARWPPPAPARAPTSAAARPPEAPSAPRLAPKMGAAVATGQSSAVAPSAKRPRLGPPLPSGQPTTGLSEEGQELATAALPSHQGVGLGFLPPVSQARSTSTLEDLPLSQLPGGTLPSLSQFSASDAGGFAAPFVFQPAPPTQTDEAPDTGVEQTASTR